MNKKQYYFLLPYCFIVEGKNSNIIFNAQKCDVIYIPYSIISLIKLFDENNIEEIEQIYSNQKEDFREIIAFLIQRGLIGIKSKDEIFPHINFDYHSPEHIKHLVIEYSNRYNFNKVLTYTNKLLAKFIEIRYENLSNDIQKVNEHITLLYKSTIKAAQLIFDYKFAKILFEKSKQKDFDIVSSIIFYNSPYSRSEIWGKKNIQYIQADYDYIKFYNNDYSRNYILDLHYFILSHFYNPYYYKRLCIDENGNIKNCLKNEEVFGNVNENDIMTIVRQKRFRTLWFVSSDKIIDIKDNPMRYNMYVTNQLRKEKNGLYSIIR